MRTHTINAAMMHDMAILIAATALGDAEFIR
jgi:hypothetical protein